MTIIDAIESGKPFRRNGDKPWETWFKIINAEIYEAENPDFISGPLHLTYFDLIAKDWEIKNV